MNWLSTMKTRSNLAFSANRACSMYQLMLMLASPGIQGQATGSGGRRHDAGEDGAELDLAVAHGWCSPGRGWLICPGCCLGCPLVAAQAGQVDDDGLLRAAGQHDDSVLVRGTVFFPMGVKGGT